MLLLMTKLYLILLVVTQRSRCCNLVVVDVVFSDTFSVNVLVCDTVLEGVVFSDTALVDVVTQLLEM